MKRVFAQGLNFVRIIVAGGLGLSLTLAGCGKFNPQESEPFVILTPPAPPTPRINGPKIFAVRPGSPVLFRIAATGDRPMEFFATNLPANLSLDQNTGQITGTLTAVGRYSVILRATNQFGSAERTLEIVCGDEIALTPPMGWNSWNCWAGKITQEKTLAAARALVTSGLRDHGWSYVNIDDGWQGRRGGEFNAIQPNAKFPGINALANEIHSLGLKFGIYSTPWKTTFLGQIGSSADFADGSNEWIRSGVHNEFFKYRFPEFHSRLRSYAWLRPLAMRSEERERKKITKKLRVFGEFSFVRPDVAQWAKWNVDYVKYDWIPIDVAHTEEMGRALRASGRDIVFSVANNAALSIAPQISPLANSWRTSGDVKDNWASVSKTGFTRERWAQFSRPGHYNDPDMLVVGQVGWGKPHPTNLSPNEQYTQMSLWCLLAAPLFLGCDLEKLDPFTLGLITNDEVIAVDQDPLCLQATRVARRGSTEIYAKPLADGSWAIGLFNRARKTKDVSISWSELKEAGAHSVRDLWRQKDLGVFAEKFSASVPPHGVMLVRVAR
ncbi:MAG: putative Ig domain-containing protein [Verrucomicrobiota bacterium]|nr:putative Ig domain-containing protein [Verrucomicrobiota bacterium]